MTIIIKSEDNNNPVLFTTVAPSNSSDKITGSFFDENSFGLTTVPVWQTNYSSEREGGFKHYKGSKDGSMNVLLHLTGTTRFDDLQTWRSIAGGTIFYLNSDTDSNLNGNYVITGALRPKYFPNAQRVELSMTWEAYNN